MPDYYRLTTTTSYGSITETTEMLVTEADMLAAADEMKRTGGGFAEAISTAWYRADASNKDKLAEAFGELFGRYVKLAYAYAYNNKT
jgi:hypothetical protein